jgi:hypothetical protein
MVFKAPIFAGRENLWVASSNSVQTMNVPVTCIVKYRVYKVLVFGKLRNDGSCRTKRKECGPDKIN